ncbi:T9SS type A sorting domain-containing protein [Riemerella anatipestifer]
MHYKNYFLVAGLCVAMLFKAQQTQPELYDPYTPEYFSVGKNDPAWLQLIVDNPSGVNFFEMEKKFGEWLDSDPDARRKTPEKKPAVNFYRRWQKAYRPFVNGNGEIVLPKKEDYLAKLDRQNQRSNQTMVKHQRGLTALATTPTTNKWKNIGPFSTARNTPNPDPDGNYYVESYDSHANVFRIDVFKKDANILYSGAETGAVFKTTDKGKNWTACASDFNFGTNITAIRIDPNNADIVWVGSTSGLFVSKNGGISFDRIKEITTTVNSIRVSNDGKIVTVTTGEQHKFNASKPNTKVDGFFISEDKGATFRRVMSGIFYDHELKPNNSKVVYLYGRKDTNWHSQLYISYDGGKNFDNGRDVLSGARPGRLAVSDAPGGENYLYALVNVENSAYSYGQPHILQSKDAGLTWTDKTTITSNRNETKNTFCYAIDGKNGGQGYYDMMIGVSGKDPEHVIFGLCSAYRSLKGGEGGYFHNSIGGYCNGNFSIHADMQDIAIAGDEVWIANDGGIKYSPNFFKRDNEGKITGENRIKGIYASDYWGFGQGWNEDVMVGGRWHNGDAVMMENYEKGKAVYVGGVEYPTGYVMVSNPKKVYFSDSGMFTMPNNIEGRVTTDYRAFIKQPYETLRTHGFFGTDPRYAQRILYHPKEGAWSATMQIWETPDEGVTSSLLYDAQEYISNIEFARSNPNVIYACGRYFIYKSVDNGKSWSQLSIPKPGGVASYIAVDPKDENKVWLVQFVTSGKNGGLLYSEDGGQSWKNVLENSPTMRDKEFRWIILAGDQTNGVYLGSESGAYVYYKDDTMSDWIDYSNGLPPAARLTRLVPFFKEGKLRAATSQGIWEIPLYRENFTPVAQPMATNISQARLNDANMTVQFESYSIVNQKDAQWEWSFSPKPHSIDNPKARNPKVVFKYNGEYDVTLKVKTPQGEHSRTIKKMIIVDNGVLGTSETQTSNPKKVEVYPTLLNQGDNIHIKMGVTREKAQFRLYDASGTLVKTEDIETNTPQEVTISTQGLPKGVYLFQYSTYSYIQRGKLVIK